MVTVGMARPESPLLTSHLAVFRSLKGEYRQIRNACKLNSSESFGLDNVLPYNC
jgi:hypothetical protein